MEILQHISCFMKIFSCRLKKKALEAPFAISSDTPEKLFRHTIFPKQNWDMLQWMKISLVALMNGILLYTKITSDETDAKKDVH